MLNLTIRRLLTVGIAVALASLLLAPGAYADHGEGHNGETLELSNHEGIHDGEVVTVSLSSWLPGSTATVVTCYVYPALGGPSDCELSNYGQHTVEIGEDGTGSLEYPVVTVDGRCDETTACFVVAGDGFGPAANYAAQEFTFAPASAAEPELISEPEPTAEPTAEPTPEADDDSGADSVAAATDDDDDDRSVWVWLLPAIIVVAVLALAGLWMLRRRSA